MKKVAKKTTIDDLAIMVARGFDEAHKNLTDFKSETEENFKKVDDNFKIVRNDILGLHDKFVSELRFNQALL